MARTTVPAVKSIIDTSLSDPNIQEFINIANEFVSAELSDVDLGTTRLTQIEKWMAAHFMSITKERMTSDEKLGEAAIKYTGKYGAGWHMTSYGQMVLTLDTSGTLAEASKKKISIKAVTSFD